MLLTRDTILQVDDLPREPIELPEWGGSAFVRCMTGAERERYESELSTENSLMIRAAAVVLSLCDAQGARLFHDSDMPAVAQKHWAVLDRIFTVAKRLSLLTGSDVEQAEKNSSGELSTVSGSDSPLPSGAV